MNHKEQLAKIFNLNISEKIEQMDDDQINEYTKKLHSFIGDFPAQGVKIKEELTEKAYDNCYKSLSTVHDMLKEIYADILAEECMKQAENIQKNEHEKSVAYISNFLAAISALSIDIQMALYKKDEQSSKGNDAAEGEKTNNILAVDDVAFFLNRLKAFLKDTSCKLTCVNSGEAALRYIRKYTPDLFLLDIDMPEMDGFELAKELKASGQKAPIIFLTGNAMKSYVMKAISVGASDFIIKPINRDQLLEKIGKFIKLETLIEENKTENAENIENTDSAVNAENAENVEN